jgi:hypothetical protein
MQMTMSGHLKIAAALFAVVIPARMNQATAQTTNPDLNRLLDAGRSEVEGAKADINAIRAKDHRLRQACWSGNHESCLELKAMLVNPNINPDGIMVPRPSGAYWPFNPY